MIKSALKCKWKQRWNSHLTFSFRIFFFSNELSPLSREEKSVERMLSVIASISSPTHFPSSCVSCSLVYWTYIHTYVQKKFVKLDKRWECTWTHSKKEREEEEEEERNKYFFINPNEEKKYIFASSVVVPVSSRWNAHNITRFLLRVVVTIIFIELSVIYNIYIYIWVLYLILNIGSIWAKQILYLC